MGGIIIADDGTNLVCGSIYSLSHYIEEFKLRKRTQEETNQIMKELDEIIGFNGDKTEQKDTKLQRLIEENCGPDPFWKDCLDNYFKNVNKTGKEKEDFLLAISKDKMLFNEFTREIVKVSLNMLNADAVFEKYKTIINDKLN